ncbi:hypothetical protein CcCBS67573_g04359 [Chytriomyces confervae]|uniref:Endonuclease/exonuclease/phosphatase domain-containing protein n=1 Tax=Chytriomyces confervae TaxID=246404 RepID=A0A507FDE4_9FUNG|nr:hypothetical protein HDU80_006320 [Chytriomyces hyalinus]TPX74369.1 hypothetical protein CcCBS67573_g04359 [Chytriomyces confervae]
MSMSNERDLIQFDDSDEDVRAEPAPVQPPDERDAADLEEPAHDEHIHPQQPDIPAPLSSATAAVSLELDWDLIGGESKEWRNHIHTRSQSSNVPVHPVPYPPAGQSLTQTGVHAYTHSTSTVTSGFNNASTVSHSAAAAHAVTPNTADSFEEGVIGGGSLNAFSGADTRQSVHPKRVSLPLTSINNNNNTNNISNHYTPISICSFNTALVPDTHTQTSISLPLSPTSTTTASARSRTSNSLAVRAERILDFCRSIHVCLLQEVWGPGVDVLTSGLSLSHSIPSSLRSSNIPVLTDAVNTLSFYFARTGGLWVAHSRVGDWADSEDARKVSPTDSRQKQARYPPSKRPIPHLSLPSIPLTVPALKTFSGSRSRNGIRALLLDVSDAWGPGKRLLLFNLQLDPHDGVKRRLQLREVAQFIQEVVLSLTSLIPLNPNQKDMSNGGGGGSQPTPPILMQRSFSAPRHRRSESSPQQPTPKSLRKTGPSNASAPDEFDMIDEYAAAAAAVASASSISAGGHTTAAALSGGAAAGSGSRHTTPTSPHLFPSPMSPFDLLNDPSLAGSPTTTTTTSTSNTFFQPFAMTPLSQHTLPPKLLPHLQAIASQTGMLIMGDFNINARTGSGQTSVDDSDDAAGTAVSPEYAAIMNLLGPQGRIEDLFAGVERGNGEGDTVSGDGRNRLVKAGSVLGRVDYMLQGHSMGVPTAASIGGGGVGGSIGGVGVGMKGVVSDGNVEGGRLPLNNAVLTFLELEMVEGSVVGSETGMEMSDHWPLLGLFRPRVV